MVHNCSWRLLSSLCKSSKGRRICAIAIFFCFLQLVKQSYCYRTLRVCYPLISAPTRVWRSLDPVQMIRSVQEVCYNGNHFCCPANRLQSTFTYASSFACFSYVSLVASVWVDTGQLSVEGLVSSHLPPGICVSTAHDMSLFRGISSSHFLTLCIHWRSSLLWFTNSNLVNSIFGNLTFFTDSLYPQTGTWPCE